METELTPERKTELEGMCRDMEAVSSMFYWQAVQIGNHAFIEFCGLMNEYIKVCRTNIENGIDFTKANTHTGKPLVFAPYHAEYLWQKLDCIYGPSLASLVKQGLLGDKQGEEVSQKLIQRYRQANSI